MSRIAVQLLTFMPPEIDFTGPVIKGAGYYGPTIGYTTIQIQTLNFQGRLFIEGSNIQQPSDSDWFPIQLIEGYDYITYPRFNLPGQQAPIYGLAIDWYSLVGVNGESSTTGYSFYLNSLWLRARIQRSHFLPYQLNPAQIEPFGVIDSILLSF
jgi:hypothetical protein